MDSSVKPELIPELIKEKHRRHGNGAEALKLCQLEKGESSGRLWTQLSSGGEQVKIPTSGIWNQIKIMNNHEIICPETDVGISMVRGKVWLRWIGENIRT